MRNGCSDLLYRLGNTTAYEKGGITFTGIIDLYRGQISEELGPPLGEAFEDRIAKEMHEAADIAESIYERCNTDEEAAQVMQESENERVIAIGKALQSPDWSNLAL